MGQPTRNAGPHPVVQSLTHMPAHPCPRPAKRRVAHVRPCAAAAASAAARKPLFSPPTTPLDSGGTDGPPSYQLVHPHTRRPGKGSVLPFGANPNAPIRAILLLVCAVRCAGCRGGARGFSAVPVACALARVHRAHRRCIPRGEPRGCARSHRRCHDLCDGRRFLAPNVSWGS